MERTALPVAVVAVDAGAHHELALVGLRDVDVHGVGHHDAVEDRLVERAHERLQRVGLHRQAEPDHLGEDAGVSGGHERHLVRPDRAARGLDARDRPPVAAEEARHLRVLDDVDAALARAGRERPGDAVVAGGAAPTLERAAHHRVAHVRRDVDDRAELLHLLGVEHLGVDALQVVGLDATVRVPHLADVVQDVEHALLIELEVPVEVVLQALPELERVLVDRGRGVPQVVGADHGRVAGDVAAGEPALLDDAHVGDAVVPGQVVGGGQAVAAAADDDDLIGVLRLGVSPVALRFFHRPPAAQSGRTARVRQRQDALRATEDSTRRPGRHYDAAVSGTGVARCATSRGDRCSP